MKIKKLKLKDSFVKELSFFRKQVKFTNPPKEPIAILDYSHIKPKGKVRYKTPTVSKPSEIKQVIDFSVKQPVVSVSKPVATRKDKTATSKIKVGTFEGVKEITNLVKDYNVRKEWGLTDKQYKELGETYKKIKQAEKAKGTKAEKLKQSAMRKFYDVVGLSPTGQLTSSTNKDMFAISSPRKENGEWVGGGVITAKIPIKQNIPILKGGNIDTLDALANNFTNVKLSMDYYNIAQKLNSWIVESEYKEWAEAFIISAGFGDIDDELLGALTWLSNNVQMLNKTANWLKNRGVILSLKGNIAINIANVLNGPLAKEIPPDIKAFLIEFLHNLK